LCTTKEYWFATSEDCYKWTQCKKWTLQEMDTNIQQEHIDLLDENTCVQQKNINLLQMNIATNEHSITEDVMLWIQIWYAMLK